MKRRVPLIVLAALTLVLVLVLGLLVAGCDEEEEATGPDDSTAPVETITLKYADQNAETGWAASEAAAPWLDMVEEATDNQVEIDRYFGGTIFAPPDAWEALKAGQADMSWLLFQYWANLAPRAEVVTLPFMPFESAEQASAITWTLYEEFSTIADEFKDVHPAVLWASTPYYLMTTDKAVRTPADMKGLKIRALGGPPTDLVEALGGVAVGMPMPNVYQELQTGNLDGVLTNWESIIAFRHYDVCKYLTLVPFHGAIFGVAFNNDSWDDLPADIQDDIMSVGGMTGAKFWGKNMFDTAAAEVPQIAEDEGYDIEIITFTDDEIETIWKQPYGEPLWEAWVDDMEAAGYDDAQDILDRCLELIDEM